MQLSVIIVNYNVKYFLEQCLCSVTKACKHIDAEIIVIDNLSTDGSRDYFSDKFSTVKFIWNTQNAGFSKANNLALLQATGNYVLFLNPDTILAEDSLEKAILFLQQQKDAGALGIRMIDGSGQYLKESKRGFPSLLTSFFKLTGITALFPSSKLLAPYYMGHLSPTANSEVDILSGAFMLIPKTILNLTGGFDESFFMYGEDIDLCYRIQKAGYKNYYFAESTIIHFKGESTQKHSARYLNLFYGAMILFVKKHYSPIISFVYRLLIRFALVIRAVLSFVVCSVSKISLKKDITDSVRHILIVSSKNDYLKINQALLSSYPEQIISGWVNATDTSDSMALGNLVQLQEIIHKNLYSEIIFCENELSFKETIFLLENLPPKIRYQFHAKGSHCIAGSYSKDENGQVLVLPDNLQ